LTGLGDVRFGSKADIGLAAADVRFRVALGCPLSAISGPSALQQKKLFDHVIGLSQKRGWHSAGKTISRSSAKKRCDPLYRDRERIAVRENAPAARCATTPGERPPHRGTTKIRNKASRARVSMWVDGG